MVINPKRRKDKYNPYTLVYSDENNTYSVDFTDGEGKKHNVAISKEIYEAMNGFELEDISQLNKYDRYIEHSDITKILLTKKTLKTEVTLDEILIDEEQKKKLKELLKDLPDKQRQRIKLYFEDEKNLEEISELEGCSFQTISENIRLGIDTLRKNLKNF